MCWSAEPRGTEATACTVATPCAPPAVCTVNCRQNATSGRNRPRPVSSAVNLMLARSAAVPFPAMRHDLGPVPGQSAEHCRVHLDSASSEILVLTRSSLAGAEALSIRAPIPRPAYDEPGLAKEQPHARFGDVTTFGADCRCRNGFSRETRSRRVIHTRPEIGLIARRVE
jgi:hypothetical protein